MDTYLNSLISPFYYVVTSGTMIANSSVIVSLTMAADSHFELYSIMATCTSVADDDTMPNGFSCQITDQSTGSRLSSARVPQRNFAGVSSNGWGMISKYPILFPPSCILTFDILDLSAAENTVIIVLKGYKIFNVAN